MCNCNGNCHSGCSCDSSATDKCNCEGKGCSCEEEKYVQTPCVEVVLESGEFISCPIVDVFEYKDTEYIIAEVPDDDGVFIFKVINEERIELLEDEDFDRIAKAYENM